MPTRTLHVNARRQVGKLLGEEWKALSAEDKAPYEAQAVKDKERYAAAMAEYKASTAAAAGGGGGGDGGDHDDDEAAFEDGVDDGGDAGDGDAE